MCGLGGYVGNGSKEVLDTMTRVLAHRGPDGKGVWIGDGIGLAHTRLSILDLSAAASQPMTSGDRSCVLAYNGEIYNHRDLRRELQQTGEIFRSTSDTEVLLSGYRKWGRRVLERLRGMFAFALWDDSRRQLLLARDRLGIKPLYYSRLEDAFVFGSEIKALFAHPGVCRDLNPSAVDSYFELGYVPGPDTIFHGISALSPGCWLEYRGGVIETQCYWEPNFRGQRIEGREEDLIDELDIRLRDSVKSHLVADVPVGAFLSGGIDSSLVCAIAQRHCPEPLRTFTIGFDGGGDERGFARAVADHIGSNHHERLVTPDIIRQLPRLVQSLEQPFFDNSALATFVVSQQAREEVKVVLSGDGGDEPFAGYDWTRFALMSPALAQGWQPKGWRWAYQKGLIGLARRLIYDISHAGNERYQRRVSVSASLRKWLYQPQFLSRISPTSSLATETLLDGAPVQDKRDSFLYADMCRYLPEDVLFKVDRMSMANSLEVRVPLLDHHLLEWILRLPFNLRFRRGRGKYLLRKLAVRYLPARVLKPRKQGFTVPLGRWVRGELGNWIENLFHSAAFGRRGIIRPQAALEMLRMHRSRRYELGHRIWSLVMLEVWASVWLDEQDCEGILLAQ